MDLFKYSEYQNDIEKYLKQTISKFDLKYNFEILKAKRSIPQISAFYENKYCRIELINNESFPYQDVAYHFYLLNSKGDEVEIQNNDLNKFLSINEDGFKKFCLNHYDNRLKNNLEFLNSEKGGYLYAMEGLNDLILKYYYPLLDGSKSYDDYINYLNKHK